MQNMSYLVRPLTVTESFHTHNNDLIVLYVMHFYLIISFHLLCTTAHSAEVFGVMNLLMERRTTIT